MVALIGDKVLNIDSAVSTDHARINLDTETGSFFLLPHYISDFNVYSTIQVNFMLWMGQPLSQAQTAPGTGNLASRGETFMNPM